MNREVLHLEATNPIEVMNVAKRWNQALGACLRPYRDFYRRKTKEG
jgi:hypothetical protein